MKTDCQHSFTATASARMVARASAWAAGVLLPWGVFADSAPPRAEERRAAPPGPAFVHQPFYATNTGVVHGVSETSQADLVLIAGGYDSGFRNGMVCLVRNAEDEVVGEILLVEVRNECAAGVILELESGRVIEPGQAVVIKTVSF